MAAIDVLNPNRGFDEALGFNANWNYGSGRKANQNLQIQRPRLGPWNSRITANYGYTFPLTFVDRPIEQVLYLNDFYEKFGVDGFTLVDFDNGGRHHVGCFTMPPQETHGANNKYNISVTFEDLPGSAMLRYPGRFDKAGHWLYVVDSKLNPRAAVTSGTWVKQQIPGTPVDSNTTIDGVIYSQASTLDPSTYEMLCVTPLTDEIQTSYVGWGFRMTFRLANTFGRINIFLDQVLVVDSLDLSNGLAFSATGPTIVVPGDGTVVVTFIDVPLDQHRIKVNGAGEAGLIGGGVSLLFPALEYIY
jgi:hypothetical protein